MEEKTKNYYEILEIVTGATPDEIHQGYVTAKSAYALDSIALYSIMTKDECENILELIEEAYSILSNPSKRKEYDQARGLNLESSPSNQQKTPFTLNKTSDPTTKTPTPPPESNIAKIVANKRFALQYEASPEFEKVIEQTTEFSGEFLKKVREYKNVDIPRMSEMTKVSKTYIINIESEDVSRLPALVYVRGFVYQYAKCLKLNPDLVATSYLYRIKRIQGEHP